MLCFCTIFTHKAHSLRILFFLFFSFAFSVDKKQKCTNINITILTVMVYHYSLHMIADDTYYVLTLHQIKQDTFNVIKACFEIINNSPFNLTAYYKLTRISTMQFAYWLMLCCRVTINKIHSPHIYSQS